MQFITIVSFIAIFVLQFADAFVPSTRSLVRFTTESETKLFAHHPQKKIIKKKQDRRPKKHRLSDINRNNVNMDKCITKLQGVPSEYTIVSADEYMKQREQALKFWETGSSSTPWLEITQEDMLITIPSNIEPLPEGGVQKRPAIVKSGSC